MKAKIDPVIAALCKAKAKIERDGWCQNHFERDGAVCIAGALGMRASDIKMLPGAIHAILLIRNLLGEPITGWNDDPNRTVGEVLAIFDGAIELRMAELAEAGGAP